MNFAERRYRAADGRSLYYRDYGDPSSPRVPILCLTGLSRNSRDFDALARHLAPTRRVICPDYRGRGRSEYDDDPGKYHPKALLEDVRHLLVACGLSEFVAIGTSLGGILAMAFGAVAPSALQGVILNDIGPEIGDAGIDRILAFLGKDHPQDDWETATLTLQEYLPGLKLRTDDEWRAATEGTFRRGDDGRLHIDWDPKIVEPMRQRARSEELWPLFRAIRRKPVLAFRGAESDILSRETFREMSKQHPTLIPVTIDGAGHTPSLGEPEALAAIDAFLKEF